MADNKVENTEAAEEVCCLKEKPTAPTEKKTATSDEKKETVAAKPTDADEEKEENEADDKAENGDSKEENGKDDEEVEDEQENDKEADADVKACKRKSTAGDAANGVEATTPEKKQKLETAQGDEKETTEVAA